jgi:UDP-N-acetylmuramoyl-L-alanyl-D-glutamate--2,6-diaminopimelate ligase
MKLKKIIEKLEDVVRVEGKSGIEISGIACDSKLVRPGYLFAALKGHKVNGADFIDEALDRGAVAILLDAENKDFFRKGNTFIYASDARRCFSEICKVYYGDISNRMHLIGVTGTNGKTTITYLLENLFKSKNDVAGVIGTINYRFGKRMIPSLNTTPGVLEIYSLLNSMEKEKITNCIMEVSSHSLEQGRVDTLQFDTAIFTNLTREHLDYHKNMEDYFSAKLRLFTKIKKNGFAIINIDDPVSGRIIEKVREAGNVNIITYGIQHKADIMAKDIDLFCNGSKFKLYTFAATKPHPSGCGWSMATQYFAPRNRGLQPTELNFKEDSIKIKSSLIGRHNIYNILATAGAGLAMAMNLEDIKRGIESFNGLPGRLEAIGCGQDFSVYVDYAHTEDGIENVLKSLRELKPKRLICIFGCGGDRDRAKRPVMARISTELSDKVFITSDNPRTEEPMDIINEIIKGISPSKNNYVIEPDRFNAIKKALSEGQKGDIVLVAGKGHETYQIFKDVTIPFDDREVVKKILKEVK